MCLCETKDFVVFLLAALLIISRSKRIFKNRLVILSILSRHRDAVFDVEFGRMERNLYRIHRDVMPQAPKTPEEIVKMFSQQNIKDTFGMSLGPHKEEFYKDTVIEKNFAYTIFQSKGICNFVESLPASQRNYMLDGTFQSVPRGDYQQLLIIYIEYCEHVSFPVSF